MVLFRWYWLSPCRLSIPRQLPVWFQAADIELSLKSCMCGRRGRPSFVMRNQSKSRRWLIPAPILSRRFGVFVFLTMILWTYTLFTFALFRSDPDVPESEKLKEQILELSKRYVKALADEQGQGKNLPETYSSYGEYKTSISLGSQFSITSLKLHVWFLPLNIFSYKMLNLYLVVCVYH